MFLDGQLRAIEAAKNAVSTRCELRRTLLTFETMGVRSRIQGVLSGLQAGMAVVEAVRAFLSDRKKTDG